jgi:hypothetical protein
MAFTNMPKYADDGITENPCWPKVILDDPGFALRVDDPWYDKHGKPGDTAAARQAKYKRPPTAADINGKAPVRGRLGKGCQWKREDDDDVEQPCDNVDGNFEDATIPDPEGLGVGRRIWNSTDDQDILPDEQFYLDFDLESCDSDECVEEWYSMASSMGYDGPLPTPSPSFTTVSLAHHPRNTSADLQSSDILRQSPPAWW